MTEDQRKKQIVEWVVTGIALIAGLYNQLAMIKNWPHIEIVDAEITKLINWLYDTVVGGIAFWRNNNITSFAQISQLVLNALKNKTITPTQVEDLINNDTVKMVSEKLQDKSFNPELIEAFLVNSDLQEVAQAELDNKEIKINIEA